MEVIDLSLVNVSVLNITGTSPSSDGPALCVELMMMKCRAVEEVDVMKEA
jgi:hypothetical protein